MSSWLCILNRENFKVVKEQLVWGVSERHKTRLISTKQGDICAFYLISDVDRVPAIGGVFKVESDPYEDWSDIFPFKRSETEIYPHRVRLSPIKVFEPELIFKPMVQDMKFITNKRHYAGHVMGRAMFEIPEEDIKLILTKYK
jgi:predicted RNA-binding protein